MTWWTFWKQHLNSNPTISPTIAQYGEIHQQLHNMVKFTNNCTTWWNSPTIAQHGEIHQQLHNMVKFTNNCATWWNWQTIAQHGEIHHQLHNMVKFTNNCTTWWNSPTIAQHGKIYQQLHNMVKFINYYIVKFTMWKILDSSNTPNRNYENYRSCLNWQLIFKIVFSDISKMLSGSSSSSFVSEFYEF